MICLVDYGMGNLRSVAKALENLGAKVRVSTSPKEICQAKAIVLPGVGAFAAGMQNLKKQKLLAPLKAAIAEGKPFLGLCLGMQLLFSESEEGGRIKGLDVLKGMVVRFRGKIKIPQIGWNQLEMRKVQHPLLRGISHQSFFYFVHSYYCQPQEKNIILATTNYGTSFTSAVASGKVFGLQFHPEKSAEVGFQVLKNFLALVEGKC
jgi:glutamine amidotransferase